MTQPPLLTARQAAARMAVHPNTVKRLIQRGQLPAYRVGSRGDWRLDPRDLDAYLEAHRVG